MVDWVWVGGYLREILGSNVSMLVGEMLTYFSFSFFSFLALLAGICACSLFQRTHILKLVTETGLSSAF